MKMWMKVLIGLFSGLLVGLLLGDVTASLKPIGTLFINLISMVITPLILSAMTTSIASMPDTKKIGKLGLIAFCYYIGTTLIAVSTGMGIGYLTGVGSGMPLFEGEAIAAPKASSIGEILLKIVPSNPVAALADGNVLQIILFSLFLGIAIHLAGEKGKPALRLFESLQEVMLKMTGVVLQFAPYGVFAIMAWIGGSFGIDALKSLAWFITVYYITCILFVLVVFCGILWLFARVNPIPFFKGMTESIILAFSTGSSSATLPVCIQAVTDKLGVSKQIASFILPLGAMINMNGTALFQGMAALFVAQAFAIPLDFGIVATIAFTATLSAIGTAGVPGSGFIMLSVVLSSAGLPLEGLAVLLGIDRLRDMIGTALNIMGDAVITVAIASHEKELDLATYYMSEKEPLPAEGGIS